MKNVAFNKNWIISFQELWIWKYQLLTFLPHHGIKEGLIMYDILNITSYVKTLEQDHIVIRNL